MALSDELINTVDGILTQYAPSYRMVYKRKITRTGGDTLIRRSVRVSYVDILLSPQPVFRHLDSVRGNFYNSTLTQNSNINVLLNDYSFVLSVNAITRDELIDKDVVLVLKDVSTNEEVLRLVDFVDPAVNNTVVAYIAFYRSIDR
jgi:hypothetical protein